MSSSLLKKLGLVSGVLLLLWIVYLYRQVPHARAPFAKAADAAERIVLEQGSGKVELQKQGSAWKVASSSGPLYAADEERVRTLLSGIKDVQVEDEISDRADRAAEFEVDAESGTRVRLVGPSGSQSVEGVFGKQSPDISHIYFRYPDQPNVYLARGIMRGDLGTADVNSWRSRQLMDLPETKIQAITIEGKGYKTELVRMSTDSWTLNGKEVEPGPINILVGTLAHLTASNFIDSAAYPGLTYEGLTYALVLVKGADASFELKIGAEDAKSKQYPVSINKDAGLAWIPEAGVNTILQYQIKR
jgi:hypothetical protein